MTDKIEVTQADMECARNIRNAWDVNCDTASEIAAFHHLATRTDATPVADSDETFLTAYVSADTNIIGIDHPTEAPWQQVYAAHIALRDRLNERLEQEDLCPYKPEADTNTHPPATDVAALVEQRCPSCGVKFREIVDVDAHIAALAPFTKGQK